MTLLLAWWPWILVALIPGIFNVLVAYKRLDKECQFYPFFRPYQSFGFWIWLLINLILPALTFWMLYSVATKPAINPDLVTKAIVLGLVFTALVNAYVDTGFFGVDLKQFYSFLTGLAYGPIAAGQNLRSTNFWIDFQTELSQGNQNLEEILDFLEEYLLNDVSLTVEDKQNYQKQIAQARTVTPRREQVKIIKSLMFIRRRDLPTVLKRFGCSDAFLHHYFGK